MCIFAMLGALMFVSKLIMEVLPNVHLLGMLTMVCAATYRWRGLIPIYVYVLLSGIYSGFSLWWIPYLYIWTVLWGMTMLTPQKLPRRAKCIIYPAICALHGFAFGTLYAPAQAIMFGLSFDGMIAWIIAGLPYDMIHGVSNIFTGLLVLPLSELLRKLSK